MSDTTVAIIGALISGPVGVVVGTVFGYWLNEHGIRQREARAEAHRLHNARTLLYWEIEEDLAELRDFMQRVKHQPDGAAWEGSSTEIAFQERYRFLQLPPPRLSHDCWSSQLPDAPSLLTRHQLSGVYAFYSQLEKIRAMYGVLSTDAPDETLCVAYEEWKSSPPDQRAPLNKHLYFRFPDGAPMGPAANGEPRLLSLYIERFLHGNSQRWAEFEELIDTLAQRGNPLPKPDEQALHQDGQPLPRRLTNYVRFHGPRRRRSNE